MYTPRGITVEATRCSTPVTISTATVVPDTIGYFIFSPYSGLIRYLLKSRLSPTPANEQWTKTNFRGLFAWLSADYLTDHKVGKHRAATLYSILHKPVLVRMIVTLSVATWKFTALVWDDVILRGTTRHSTLNHCFDYINGKQRHTTRLSYSRVEKGFKVIHVTRSSIYPAHYVKTVTISILSHK